MPVVTNSPRGLFTKQQINVGSQELTYNSTTLNISGGIKISGAAGGVITANSTSANFAGGIKVSNENGGLITANSTGATFAGTVTLGGALVGSHASKAVLIDSTAALPGSVSHVAGFVLIDNSTGQTVAVNTTGTTWKYLNVTSVQPT